MRVFTVCNEVDDTIRVTLCYIQKREYSHEPTKLIKSDRLQDESSSGVVPLWDIQYLNIIARAKEFKFLITVLPLQKVLFL